MIILIDLCTQDHKDLAAACQKLYEFEFLRLVKTAKLLTHSDNLVLGGGCAYNGVANSKAYKFFKSIHIPFHPSDAGSAIGACLLKYKGTRKNNTSPFLGPKFHEYEISRTIETYNNKIKNNNLSNKEIIKKTASLINSGNVIGWFQGRMEFGPRALGARSILGDPRSDKMQKNLNLKVKYRESFRPFAPSILREDLSDWFNINVDSPYMLLVADVNSNKKIEMNEEQKKLFGIDKLNIKRSEIPAVTHVDYSARIQTVSKKTNKPYYDLISKFKEITGCPVLVNTSFNVRGEPIVNSPTDAFNCFMGTDLDYLVIGNCILDKTKQNQNLKKNYKNEFELD